MSLKQTGFQVNFSKKRRNVAVKKKSLPPKFQPFYLRGLVSNSPYCLPNDPIDVSLENFVLDQLQLSLIDIFFILPTCPLDIILLWCGKILP